MRLPTRPTLDGAEMTKTQGDSPSPLLTAREAALLHELHALRMSFAVVGRGREAQAIGIAYDKVVRWIVSVPALVDVVLED